MAVTPNALNAQSDGDLVITTLRDLGRGRFTDISSALQTHTALRHLMTKKRLKFESGYGLQWTVKALQSNAAANVGLGASDNVNIVDTNIQATANWAYTTTNYAIIGQEIDMNRDPARIVDLVKSRRFDAMISLAELMEANFWGPPVASNDGVTPYGVNTWIVKNATQGLNGGAPSGFTTIGGINPTTYPQWNNWTDSYTVISKDDLVRKMRKAATFTDFRPTVDGMPTFDTGDTYGFYTNYGVISPMEEIGESQNDNLGQDVASQDGRMMFRRQPLNWVPYLEADTTNPIYGIDWGLFSTFILNNWWLKETNIPNYPGQHTVSAHFLDCTYNFVAHSRRQHFVISNGTTYPS